MFKLIKVELKKESDTIRAETEESAIKHFCVLESIPYEAYGYRAKAVVIDNHDDKLKKWHVEIILRIQKVYEIDTNEWNRNRFEQIQKIKDNFLNMLFNKQQKDIATKLMAVEDIESNVFIPESTHIKNFIDSLYIEQNPLQEVNIKSHEV